MNDTGEYTPEDLAEMHKAASQFDTLTFSDVTKPGSASNFQHALQRLKEGESLPLEIGAEKIAGWSIRCDSSGRKYVLEHTGDADPAVVFIESNYCKGRTAESGAVVRPGENLLHNLWRLRLPAPLETVDTFALLSAPVVQLEDSVHSFRWNQQMHHGGRMSSGTVAGRTLFGHFAAHTDVGNGARATNEDAFMKLDICNVRLPDGTFTPGTLLLGIDGMGGHEGGLFFTDYIERVFAFEAPLGRSCDEIAQSLGRHLEERIAESYESVLEDGLPRDMGACLNVATVTRNFLKLQHRGDVRALLIRNSDLVLETNDHSHAEMLRRKGHLSADEAFTCATRHIVYDSLRMENGSPACSDRPSVADSLEEFDVLLTRALADEKEQISFVTHIGKFIHVAHTNAVNGHFLDQGCGMFIAALPVISRAFRDFDSGTIDFDQVVQIVKPFIEQTRLLLHSGRMVETDFETRDWMPIMQDDIVLIGSDGLFDVLKNLDIVELIDGLASPEEIVTTLRRSVHLRVAELGAKDDNIVIVAYRHAIPYDVPGYRPQ